jgi:ribonuclease P/MRP protein subunit RPP1
MNFYDFHIHTEFSEGKSSIEEIAKRAKLLGYKGVCFTIHFKNRHQLKNLEDKAKEISAKNNIDIFIGIEAKTIEELKKLAKIRREFDFLLVEGSDLELNRTAVQTKEVDILVHPEYNRKDSGFNHTMARLAAENNVAIEINFREILLSSKNTRANIMHRIQENVKLCKKYNTPIVICSGAVTHWQLKDPKILMSMGCLLGLDLNESKKTLSEVPEKMIEMMKERNKNWIMPGVKIVK